MKKAETKPVNNLTSIWKSINFHKIFVEPFKKLLHWLASFKHVLSIVIFALVFLYYPVGGFLINNIDRNTNVELKLAHPNQSNTINTISYLINREVNHKLWTPNLPFLFPSYFLDNMPNYQLGMISGIATFSDVFSGRISTNQDNLNKAASLLQYSGKTWMFSSNNKLIPVPSANSQYRRARKHLQKYNESLANNTEVFNKKPEDLSLFLTKISLDLSGSIQSIESHVREVSPAWIDNRGDDIFYYNQGKLYSYHMILKALGQDYKDVLVENNLYQNWVKMLKALEDGASLNPSIVRNGELNSITAPNHLNYLAYYALKAQNTMQRIVIKLEARKN